MSVEAYMRGVMEFAVFLGVSDDRTIQPDAAVAQLEHLASILQGLNENEREHFRSFVQQVAAKEEKETGRTPRVEFLSSLTENLGLD